MLTKEKVLSQILIGTGILTTLAISPGVGYDPINLPKMLVLATGASLLLPFLLFEFKNLFNSNLLTLLLASIFVATLFISIFTNDRPFFQQLWGAWGRSTGLVTYLSFLIIMLAAMTLSTSSDLNVERRYFERLTYFISLYTLLQAADLDPVNWSQNIMVSTLGNINFMSSFLGLACISFFSRAFFETIALSSKVHYVLFLFINLFLILYSKSIQGIGVLLGGAVFLMAFQIRKKLGIFRAYAWLALSSLFGILVLLGTAGIGPISGLRQETVIFRIDYWRAGLAMTKDNPLNGIGIDSYGDFYQQYRDLEAVIRTGPQRVTNTAHNIFLDVSSGSGIIAGIVFLGIFMLAMRNIISALRGDRFIVNQIVFSSMFVGFAVFCLISINQIGVGVWGFIFMGYLLGMSTKKPNDFQIRKNRSDSHESKKSQSLKTKPFSVAQVVISLLFGALGFISAFVPNQIDAKMLKTVQQRDFSEMEDLASRETAAVFYRNKYQTLAIEAGMQEEALKFARTELKRDSRNVISWRVLAFSEGSTQKERELSIKMLKTLDPMNDDLRQELKKIEKR